MLCRLLFNSTTGNLLLRVIYSAQPRITLEDEKNNFCTENNISINEVVSFEYDESNEKYKNYVSATELFWNKNTQTIETVKKEGFSIPDNSLEQRIADIEIAIVALLGGAAK